MSSNKWVKRQFKVTERLWQRSKRAAADQGQPLYKWLCDAAREKLARQEKRKG